MLELIPRTLRDREYFPSGLSMEFRREFSDLIDRFFGEEPRHGRGRSFRPPSARRR